ncbi:MAG: peptidase M23 [Microbacterium sp. SCN 70-200]|uniref:M23 family metallopeptidase n=1 Tax=unclassified Microbacterium TaxID=2609290 RepID=UPI00086C277F|nr:MULTISPECIES: M23 family metallopeptidase [unclassified Microbacterium]MBN9213536.1 M23 family metallopeptidase [Microbacterium sp.]ODT41646.1 MAG: peptidase M23 [Microbacterium sp. SCN 70-200]OJV85162.1 MAG: peptidase M23 [Microbacterium sp. 70-16]
MAENFDPSHETPESDSTTPALRSRTRRLANLRTAAKAPVVKTTAVVRSSAATRRAAGKPHPMRSLLTLAAVAGLVATVAVPAAVSAVGSAPAEAAVTTVQQLAADNAQSLVVASEATPAALDRGSYSATTPEEIQAKKDEEAAKAAAAARIAAASTASAAYSGAIAESIAPAGSVVRPLTSFNNFGTPYAGHKGTDYMADRYTPIYAIADGVVVASTEDGPGWGVYVKIAHNIGGQSVTSLYAHMSYGTRRVSVGDTVSAGQLIGQVGDTGRAYGTHLHLEIYVNGAWVNAESWLVANAG